MKAGTDGEIIVTVEESQGSVQNVMEVRARGGDYVFTTPPALVGLAQGGKAMFEGKGDPKFDEIRALFPIPSLTMHFVMSRGQRRRDASPTSKARPSCSARAPSARARARSISSLFGLEGKVTWPTRAVQRGAGAEERPDRRLRDRRLLARAERDRGGGLHRRHRAVAERGADRGDQAHAAGHPRGHLCRADETSSPPRCRWWPTPPPRWTTTPPMQLTKTFWERRRRWPRTRLVERRVDATAVQHHHQDPSRARSATTRKRDRADRRADVRGCSCFPLHEPRPTPGRGRVRPTLKTGLPVGCEWP
jgi:hypothetical protein